MSSQHLSDYDKQLLKDPAYTCIVKVKGKGAGAETMMPILRTQWALMQKEYNNGKGGIKEVGDWKEINSTIEPVQVTPVKSPEDILSEALSQIEQPVESPAKDSESMAKKNNKQATKSV